MITKLNEATEGKHTSKFYVTAQCKTYEDYNHCEDYSSLRFDLECTKKNITEEANEQSEDLEGGITFKKVEIDAAGFDDEEDCESGIVALDIEMTSDKTQDDDDLQAIAEWVLEVVPDYIEARIRGNYTFTDEFIDYSQSDYRGEETRTVEVDRTTSISRIFSNITVERLD